MCFQDLNVLDALAPKPLSVCRTKRAVYFLLAFLDFFCFCRNNFFVTAVFDIFTPLVFIWGCV